MASDFLSPFITTMTFFFFFFFLLIFFHTSTTLAAENEYYSSNLPNVSSRSSEGSVMRRKGLPFATRKHGMEFNKIDPSRSSPSPKQGRISNASAHEVPSGPNPISNRLNGVTKNGHKKGKVTFYSIATPRFKF